MEEKNFNDFFDFLDAIISETTPTKKFQNKTPQMGKYSQDLLNKNNEPSCKTAGKKLADVIISLHNKKKFFVEFDSDYNIIGAAYEVKSTNFNNQDADYMFNVSCETTKLLNKEFGGNEIECIVFDFDTNSEDVMWAITVLKNPIKI